MAQQLRADNALVEGLNLGPSIHSNKFTVTVTPAPEYLMPSLGLHRHQNSQIHRHTHTHNLKCLNCFKKKME